MWRPCEDTGGHAHLQAEEIKPAHTLTLNSSLQDYEKVNFYCLSRQGCGSLLWQPQETSTRGLC